MDDKTKELVARLNALERESQDVRPTPLQYIYAQAAEAIERLSAEKAELKCEAHEQAGIRASLERELAALKSASAEPVAWMVNDPQGGALFFRKNVAMVPGVPLYLHPAPAVPEGLVDLLKQIRPEFGAVGSRDVDVRRQQEQIDAAIAVLAAAPKPPAQEDAKDAARIRVPTTEILDRREIIEGLEAQIAAMKEAKE